MKALFIGRFQPFHMGHLKVVQNISKEYDEIIIGIGSSQYNNTLDNPFTLNERKKMINKALEKQNIDNYRIETIPDIHNPPKWVDHVLSIITDFDIVISNNSFTKRLFSEKGHTVKNSELYKKIKYSGKVIRKKMINNEPWDKLVPEEVYKIIKEINGEERLKKLS